MVRSFFGSAPQIEFIRFVNRLFLAATFPSTLNNVFEGEVSVQLDANVHRETVVFDGITVPGSIEF